MTKDAAPLPPAIPDAVWDMFKERLGYDDEELAAFKSDPRNARVIAVGPELVRKTIVFEVVESHGCNCGHTAGTKFYFSGEGMLLAKMSPPRVCAFAIPVMTQAIYGIHELIYAGADPNSLCFKRGACFDVGVLCGGWGRIVVEARVMDRDDATALWAAAPD